MAEERVYLYLARRDRRGVKILTVLPEAEKIYPTRIPDIRILYLETSLERNIQATIYDNRMYWEPWIESAKDYVDLIRSLRRRGYRRIPVSINPVHELKLWQRKPTTKAIPRKKPMLKRKRSKPS